MSAYHGFSPEQFEERGAGSTAREIFQQPAVWRETGKTVAARREAADAFLRPLLARPELRIVLTGAGTSAFVGEILAPALSRRLGRRVDAVATTDIVSNPRECFAGDQQTLLVSFARSGNSPESVAAVELADRCLSACHHLILTCDPRGRLYRERAGDDRSFALLMPEAANDRGFAMTSSFTSMALATWLLLGDATPGDLVEKLAAAAEEIISGREGEIHDLASAGYERVVYLGSGSLKGLARESSLKALELTAGAVVATFDSPLGFRHGPKAIIDGRTLAVVYVSGDPYTKKYDKDLLSELRGFMRPGSVVALTADPEADDPGTWALGGLAGVDDAAIALPFAVVAQLLGLHLSLVLGLTPDNPFPGGEVNRVVENVTIHALPPADSSDAGGA